MSRSTTVFCLLALVAGAVFIRLGVWQLTRLHERRVYNVQVQEHSRGTPALLSTLPRDTGAAHFRPVRVSGRFDYAHELVVANRTRDGSPGVVFLTPLLGPRGDTAVLVHRGWVYSPDGSTADRARWREGDTVTVEGYAETFSDVPETVASRDARIVRRLNHADIQRRLPYPVSIVYVVQTSDTAGVDHPARHPLPVLSEGNHRNYAIQWFFFAAVALVGAGIVARREVRAA